MTSPIDPPSHNIGENPTVSATPFLRWAGGKRAVAPKIASNFPKYFEHYYEPFVGAGSLMFQVPSKVVKHISDYNEELVLTYTAIQKNLENVIAALSKHVVSKQHYLEVREWDRDPEFKSKWTESERAARFIYLNKCGFNGLYRVNSKGHYNIPYGNPKETLDLIAETNLRAVNQFLNGDGISGGPQVRVFQGGFQEVLYEWFDQKGIALSNPSTHFVYLDPPYDVEPFSPVPGFVSYTENGFGEQHQRKLAETVKYLTKKGIPVLMSNTKTTLINELYPEGIFGYENLEVRRSISAKSSSRGTLLEVLIDNFDQVGVKKKDD